MVDPIDGTSDFILGDTGFVVMIGLAIDGRPKVGAVGPPTLREGLRRDRRRRRLGRGEQRRRATRCTPPRSRARPGSGWWRPRRTGRRASTPIKRALQITDEMNVGSVGLKIGLVTEAVARSLHLHRRADEDLGHLRPGGDPARRRRQDDRRRRQRRWSTTAEELYNRRGIVASNGPLHDFVIATLAPASSSDGQTS